MNIAKSCLFFICLALPLSAQEAKEEKRFGTVSKLTKGPGLVQEGWSIDLKLGARFGWSMADKVQGLPDGHKFNFGARFKGQFDYSKGRHALRNTVVISEGFTQKPDKDWLVKDFDGVSLDSIYLYYLTTWFGTFGQLKLDTSIFSSDIRDKKDKNKKFHVTNLEGVSKTSNTDQFRLNTSFLPLYLQETAGVFAQPIRSKELLWEFKAGLSALEVFADGTYDQDRVTVDKQYYLHQLQSFQQIGPLLGTVIQGELWEELISYEVGVDTMYPVWTFKKVGDSSNDFLKSIVVDAYADLSVRLNGWLKLTYEFKALRLPEIQPEFQLLNVALLDFSYSM